MTPGLPNGMEIYSTLPLYFSPYPCLSFSSPYFAISAGGTCR